MPLSWFLPPFCLILSWVYSSPPSCIVLLLSMFTPPSCILPFLSMFIPAILYFAAFVYVYPRHLVFFCCCLCLSPPSCILLLLSMLIPAILYFVAVVYVYPRHLVFCCFCLCDIHLKCPCHIECLYFELDWMGQQWWALAVLKFSSSLRPPSLARSNSFSSLPIAKPVDLLVPNIWFMNVISSFHSSVYYVHNSKCQHISLGSEIVWII